MLKPRIVLPSLGLCALILNGCLVTQAQFFAHFDLPSTLTIDSSTDPFAPVPIDLNTIHDYSKHKDHLKGLSEVAVVGKFTNTRGPAGSVQVWITPDLTPYATIQQVKANGTLLWSGSIGAATAEHDVDWDESARLIDPAGKAILIREAKGDGVFMLYVFGTAGDYRIDM